MGNNSVPQNRFVAGMRRERRGRGWSQADLAAEMRSRGLSAHPTTVAKIEAGDRSLRLDEAVTIASAFGMTVDELLTEPRYNQGRVLSAFVSACTEAASETNELAERINQKLDSLQVAPTDMEERSQVADLNPETVDGDLARSMLAVIPANEAISHLIEAREALRSAVHYATQTDKDLGDRAKPERIRASIEGWRPPRDDSAT